MTEDPRKIGLKDGLRQLTILQLHRVLNYSNEMVLDEYNYQDGKFCPLAIALELDQCLTNPSHTTVYAKLVEMGYRVYNTRGIEGEFYTNNRKEDLLRAAKEVLEEKIQQEVQRAEDVSNNRFFTRLRLSCPYGLFDLVVNEWVLDCFDWPHRFETPQAATEFATKYLSATRQLEVRFINQEKLPLHATTNK